MHDLHGRHLDTLEVCSYCLTLSCANGHTNIMKTDPTVFVRLLLLAESGLCIPL